MREAAALVLSEEWPQQARMAEGWALPVLLTWAHPALLSRPSSTG